jgi:tRNA A37 threonylcarbamoyladenosine modification protein TsaB
LKNLLIFDGSTVNIIFGGYMQNAGFIHTGNFEKSKMSRQLPDFFLNFKPEIMSDTDIEVIIGSGPGPFTGLKTSNSFFLGFLYSLGITKVKLVSSFRIISALTPVKSGLNKLVVIPFNKGEYFLALLDCFDNLLVKDEFVKEPFENIAGIFKDHINSKIELIPGSECKENLIETLKTYFDINSIHQGKYCFDSKRILPLLEGETLDITKEPFILNHILNPADIDRNCNIYVSNNF